MQSDKIIRNATARVLLTQGVLKDYICLQQRTVLLQLLRGEEATHFEDVLIGLAERIEKMPKTYEQDGKGQDAIVHLHYFRGNYDAWITEKDVAGFPEDPEEEDQHYGWASFYGKEEAEAGYIGVRGITTNNVKIDLYWTPKTVREALS